MKVPSLAAASALNFASGLTSVIAALVVSVLVARGLRPQGFGVYALVMAFITFTFAVARLGIPDTAGRYTAELHAGRRSDLIAIIIGRSLRSGLISGTGAALALALVSGLIAGFFRQPAMRLDLLVGALLPVPMVLLSVLQSVLASLQQYRYLWQVNLVTSPIWVAGCGFSLAIHAGIPGLLFTTLFVELLNLAAATWRTKQLAGARFDGELPPGLAVRFKHYHRSLAVLIVLDLIVWQRSELVVLGRFSTAAQTSFYAVPFGMVERIIDLIPGALLGALLPGLAYAGASRNPWQATVIFKAALRYLALLTIPICIGGFLLASWLIQLLYGPGFGPAAVVLQVLLVSALFGVLGRASRAMLLSLERQQLLVQTGAIAAVLGIALDLLLIPRWGALGAAIANAIMQAAWTVAVVIPVWRRLLVRPPNAVVAEAVASI